MAVNNIPPKKEDNRPVIFISSSPADHIWRTNLKIKLWRYALEPWDEGKFAPGPDPVPLFLAALSRATVAVVLLSPTYLLSAWTTEDLRHMAQLHESKKLTVFPIVLENCPWEKHEFLRKLAIWDQGRPLGSVYDEGADRKLDQIAERIAELAGVTRKEETDPSGEFYFSPDAEEVLRRARLLGEKSKRFRITSSCVLFALDGTDEPGRFIHEALNEKGRHDKEFEVFLQDGGRSTGEPVMLPGVEGLVSRNVAKIIRRATTIAIKVSNTRQIHTRHLFAAFLSPVPPPVIPRFDRLGVDLVSLRREFREHIRDIAKHESGYEWDTILGEPLLPRTKSIGPLPDDVTDPNVIGVGLGVRLDRTNETLDVIEHEDGPRSEIQGLRDERLKNQQTSQTSGAQPYRSTYSAYIPDRASYSPRLTNAPLDDSLGVRTYAGHLAQLIAAKETFMPLSIGLFGAWGAGKSHFIDLLDEQLRDLTKDPGKAFHKNIAQIRFNAWHYLDTNLWANLVSEIFDQLFDALKGPDDKETEQLKNLKSKLADQSALAAEAKAALTLAETVRKQAEENLRSAMQARAEEELKVSTLLDDLGNLVITPEVKKQLSDVAKGLGLPKLESSFQELEARAEEVRSLGGRTKALLLALFTGPGWWRRSLFLVVALAAPLAVSWLAAHGTPFIQELLAGAGRVIAQTVTAIAALSTWLATQVRASNALVSKLETAYDKVKAVRSAREAQDDAARAQADLAQKKQAEEEARYTLHEAEERLKTLRAELAEMAPGRQLFRFLRERATAEDYRRHLGLVSLVRRDFEQLSELLMNVPSEGGELPKIDRIVLYIDDLDRCRADRVIEVLEAVHLLLAFPLFAVVVAVDPRWLRQSLLDHYPRLLGAVDGNPPQRSVGRPATPQDYLEKIFQVPFNLHAMEKSGFESLVKHLFSVNGTSVVLHEPEIITSPPLESESESWVKDRLDNVPSVAPETTAADEPMSVPAPVGPAAAPPIEPVLPPPDPQRLVLTQDEVGDVQRFQLLFQTPRAVKRLANTYSLIRVGVDETEWNDYLGINGGSGAYRVPLFLLAVSSAFPSLARPWLLWLSETPPTRWQLEDVDVDALAGRYSDTTDRVDWEMLRRCLNRLDLEEWPPPDQESLNRWLPRVARYSF